MQEGLNLSRTGSVALIRRYELLEAKVLRHGRRLGLMHQVLLLGSSTRSHLSRVHEVLALYMLTRDPGRHDANSWFTHFLFAVNPFDLFRHEHIVDVAAAVGARGVPL